MIKVSIIVAVYNVEKYLEKCLESLLNQTLLDIEIIAVNDGSTDSSQKILEIYANKYHKLKYVTQKNSGASVARNNGLKLAKGEYIGYVDSDDFIDNNMYETMYNLAKEKNSDIVECNLRHTFSKGEDIEIMQRFYKQSELLCFGRYVVWNKIYNREWLINSNANFPENYIYEDVAFIAKLIPYISSYDYVDIAPVHYVQRLSSINNSTSEKTMHIFPIIKNVLDFYKDNGFYNQYEKELEYFYTRILLCSSFSRICRMSNKNLRIQALNQNWLTLIDAFPNWRKSAILKNEKSHQALFMKTINSFTYKIYSSVFPVIHIVKMRLSRKWN